MDVASRNSGKCLLCADGGCLGWRMRAWQKVWQAQLCTVLPGLPRPWLSMQTGDWRATEQWVHPSCPGAELILILCTIAWPITQMMLSICFKNIL